MKVSVDRELCIGCGLCESSCPDVFEMQETVAVVKSEDVPDAQEECVKGVVVTCPVEAIKVNE